MAAEIERFSASLADLLPAIPDLLVGRRAGPPRPANADELVAVGAPRDLAIEASGLLDAYGLLDCVEVALTTDSPILETARLYFALSERYEVDRLLTHITALPRADRWSSLARAALRSDLYSALEGMTRRVLASTPPDPDPMVRDRPRGSSRSPRGWPGPRATLDEIAAQDTFDLATLSVALRTIRTLGVPEHLKQST